MKKFHTCNILIGVLLLSSVLLASSCSQGQLQFGQNCVSITYIEGCAKYSQDNSCLSCEYGYSLQSGSCAVNSTHTQDCCGAYDSNGACTQCSSGLSFSDPYCVRNSIWGCISKKNGQCQVCGQGCFLSKGRCFASIPNCHQYYPSGVCAKCENGFKLEGGYCTEWPEIVHCQAQNIYGCVKCHSGYYLNRHLKCEHNAPGCIKYWQQNCISCIHPFELTKDSQCYIYGCQAYSSVGCSKCQDGLTLEDGICHYNNCIKIVQNTCVLCKSNYRLTANGCIREDTTFTCIQCAKGYHFYNGRCITQVPGCLQYDQSGCKVCREPFTRTISGECQIVGCFQYDNNGCTNCARPYVLDNRICKIPFCTKYSVEGCTCCEDGYLLTNGVCIARDQYCSSYSQDNSTCLSCVATHYLKEGRCYIKQRGCVYDQNGQCSCASGFVEKNGQCVIVGCGGYNGNKCTTCISPFVLDSQRNLCFIDNCDNYNWQGCAKCRNGYTLQNGICTTSDEYCLSYSQNGQCQKCRDGFFVLQGTNKCFKIIDGCTSYANQLTCQQCSQGYILCEGFCKPALPNCLKQTTSPEECLQCAQNYHLESGRCVPNNQLCESYKKQGNTEYCDDCVAGYYVGDDYGCYQKTFGCMYRGSECVRCYSPFFYLSKEKTCYLPGCKTYFLKGCEQCEAPFQLENDQCLIDNCLAYSKTGCTNCKEGFEVSQKVCVPADPNCAEFGNGKCQACKTGFELVNGKCFVCDPGCFNYRSDGSCFKCKSSYYLDINRRCQPKEHGCVYNNGACSYCMPPFTYDEASSTCKISNCQQTNDKGCARCNDPFELSTTFECNLPHCSRVRDGGCAQCYSKYHVSVGRCAPDLPDCMSYSDEGYCQLCRQGFTLTSTGECANFDSACSKWSSDGTKCEICGDDYFLNRFFTCEKKDGRCEAYTNGVCSKCSERYFLYADICFPYTKGCVQYSGKDCTQCRKGYTMKNGECFGWGNDNLDLLGVDDRYNFSITPIDVRQSKYYIDNLSPATAIGSYTFSSFFSSSYTDASLTSDEGASGQGWKAKYADNKQYIGVDISQDPVTFYAVQIENIGGFSVKQFYIEYSLDGVEFIKVEKPFQVSQQSSGIITIYFTGLYAKSIRMRISQFEGWPACRMEFFYYDLIRYRKISNLKSLKYLQETISSNFVDRVDNQLYINQAYFFNPSASCTSQDMCFTGLQLCKPHEVTGLSLNIQSGSLTEFYLTYSLDGRSYNCYNSCKKIQVNQLEGQCFSYDFSSALRAQGVRVYPTKKDGKLRFSPTFFYK